jgi:hypothetical protein
VLFDYINIVYFYFKVFKHSYVFFNRFIDPDCANFIYNFGDVYLAIINEFNTKIYLKKVNLMNII